MEGGIYIYLFNVLTLHQHMAYVIVWALLLLLFLSIMKRNSSPTGNLSNN